ncbi:hypothetical protein CJD36_000895 [Flavipsychrobacter stenotrophus]|uniref:Uncharacterized protein n=1 Tax=Flavipsychrobacter stenotrophus TaxID=2077091 RepID=A0A2S7SZG6_9BACT|nr:hypothetical protein CJD36_000895 [Flavipsychrobacter stenotrophus]
MIPTPIKHKIQVIRKQLADFSFNGVVFVGYKYIINASYPVKINWLKGIFPLFFEDLNLRE